MHIVQLPNPIPDSTPAPSIEPWVDIAKVSAHVGFCTKTVAQMAKAGIIPGKPFVNGRKTFWRFKLSEVDAAFALQDSNSLHTRRA